MQTTYRRTNDQSALVLCGNNMQLFQRDGRLARLGGGVGWQPLGSCCLQQMPYTANKVEFHENSLMDLTWQVCKYLCSFGAPYQTQGDLTCHEFIMSCITEGGFKSSIEHWHLVCPLNPVWELVPNSRSCSSWRLCPPTAFGNPAALCQLPL